MVDLIDDAQRRRQGRAAVPTMTRPALPMAGAHLPRPLPQRLHHRDQAVQRPRRARKLARKQRKLAPRLPRPPLPMAGVRQRAPLPRPSHRRDRSGRYPPRARRPARSRRVDQSKSRRSRQRSQSAVRRRHWALRSTWPTSTLIRQFARGVSRRQIRRRRMRPSTPTALRPRPSGWPSSRRSPTNLPAYTAAATPEEVIPSAHVSTQ